MMCQWEHPELNAYRITVMRCNVPVLHPCCGVKTSWIKRTFKNCTSLQISSEISSEWIIGSETLSFIIRSQQSIRSRKQNFVIASSSIWYDVLLVELMGGHPFGARCRGIRDKISDGQPNRAGRLAWALGEFSSIFCCDPGLHSFACEWTLIDRQNKHQPLYNSGGFESSARNKYFH